MTSLCLMKKLTKNARAEFVFKNCWLMKRADKYVEFEIETGLKSGAKKIIGRFINELFLLLKGLRKATVLILPSL